METEQLQRLKNTTISLESSVQEILMSYPPISLTEMDSVRLMDRVDTKYIFHRNELPSILRVLNTEYAVLEVEGNRISRYESIYFDTPDFDLYYQHHRGKRNRYKFRIRKYVESNLSFFEIKFKNNKGRTKKTRTKSAELLPLFIQRNSTWERTDLEEMITVNYSRITLVNLKAGERVTIDLHLEFVREDQRKSMGEFVIIEVKQGKNAISPFTKIMRQKHIRTGSISKYCFGMMHMYPHLKFNNFKPFQNRLKKINNPLKYPII